MDTIRIAERLSEGGVFTEDQAKRLATTLAYLKDELATKHDVALLRRDLEVLRTELTATFDTKLAQSTSALETKFAQSLSSLRNQLLASQLAFFIGIILYITLRL